VYGKTFLAIPADSRNARRLNADAFMVLPFAFVFNVAAVHSLDRRR
jgi:hypothetical protein